ncbi:MAG: hypothetical protein M3Y57_01180 [Acidobacteriota bacterium]|nr:hypothetical protein [Acidobacteriota bacterium]
MICLSKDNTTPVAAITKMNKPAVTPADRCSQKKTLRIMVPGELLDQGGVIRYVHPGGEFHEGDKGGMATHEGCNRELHFIKGEIARLLG